MENKKNKFIYLLIFGIILFFLVRKYKKKFEHYVDPYSIEMQADALNKMKRWNLYSSRKYSSLNNYLYPPIDYKCYYEEY